MTISADDHLSSCSQCDEKKETQALVRRGDDLWCNGCIEDEESPGVALTTGSNAVEDADPAAAATPEPRCHWYGGDCDQPADPELDDLCPFHFDACERPQHADAQREHERQPVGAGHIRD